MSATQDDADPDVVLQQQVTSYEKDRELGLFWFFKFLG